MAVVPIAQTGHFIYWTLCLLLLAEREHPQARDFCLFCLRLLPQHLEQRWHLVGAERENNKANPLGAYCGPGAALNDLHTLFHYYPHFKNKEWRHRGLNVLPKAT